MLAVARVASATAGRPNAVDIGRRRRTYTSNPAAERATQERMKSPPTISHVKARTRRKRALSGSGPNPLTGRIIGYAANSRTGYCPSQTIAKVQTIRVPFSRARRMMDSIGSTYHEKRQVRGRSRVVSVQLRACRPPPITRQLSVPLWMRSGARALGVVLVERLRDRTTFWRNSTSWRRAPPVCSTHFVRRVVAGASFRLGSLGLPR